MSFTPKERFSNDALRGGCLDCAISSPRSGEQVFALNFDDGDNTFEFCESCLSEVAKVIGFVPASRVAKAKAEAVEAQDRAGELEALLASKSEALRALTRELADAVTESR